VEFNADRTTLAIAIEAGLTVAGLILLWPLALSPRARFARRPARLAPWTGDGSDLFLFLLFVFGGVILSSGAAGALMRRTGWSDDGRLVFGIGAFQFGLFLGIASFHFGVRRLGSGLSPEPLRTLRDGIAIFLLALPVVYAVSFLWRSAMAGLGVPVANQTTLDIFTNLRSPVLRAVFSVLAIVVAPVTEELIFRAGLFRFFLGRFPYWIAVLVPAALFGGAHLLTSPMENLPTLGPLVALGAVFSIAYERTGRVGTTVVAHALFNLNTVLIVLGGLNV
jgi:membrane protease YdiL (CAAX protease family)